MKMLLAGLMLTGAVLFASAEDDEERRPARPALGKSAPTFRLNDQEGRVVTVGGETEHWTVLAFYPRARTPG